MDLIVFSSEHFGSTKVRTSKVMLKMAHDKRVFFIEKPIIGVSEAPTYFLKQHEHEVIIIQPYLPVASIFEHKAMQLDLIKSLLCDEHITYYNVWTDTPKSMPFIRTMTPEMIIYDRLADYSKSNPELEQELLEYADMVLYPNQTFPGTVLEEMLPIQREIIHALGT